MCKTVIHFDALCIFKFRSILAIFGKQIEANGHDSGLSCGRCLARSIRRSINAYHRYMGLGKSLRHYDVITSSRTAKYSSVHLSLHTVCVTHIVKCVV